jgi:6,7-dimethyl-8-ribityllumazine synthase
MEKKKNLSDVGLQGLKDLRGKKAGIVTATWNPEVTFSMRDAAIQLLSEHLGQDAIVQITVPGSFELIHASARLLESVDGVIAIGCVIQGETPHFTFISQAVANGLANLNVSSGKPVIFGVLTTNTIAQAMDRAGGEHGNKGTEAAAALLNMLSINYLSGK